MGKEVVKIQTLNIGFDKIYEFVVKDLVHLRITSLFPVQHATSPSLGTISPATFRIRSVREKWVWLRSW